MNLLAIKIENFRSIKSLEIKIFEVNKSKTFSLLWINESGKSSILKAIDFFDSKKINFPNDFFDNWKEVFVEFQYEIDKDWLQEIFEQLKKDFNFTDESLKGVVIKNVKIRRLHNIDWTNKIVNFLDREIILSWYTLKDLKIVKKENEEEQDVKLNEFINDYCSELFWMFAHKIVLWKSTAEYLIVDSIDLIKFSEEPKKTSIPLLNCFKLILIDEDSIKDIISKLNAPEAVHNLQDKLWDAVTKHIEKIWKEHPIKIKFNINNLKITFLIEDNDVKYKAKTTEQRSDWFKQFISFLLTLSIEHTNNEIEKTILLIDEPEVHLHPSAQINLLNEMISISSNKKNNIVFFATHSNYLIDKNNLNRCIKVKKEDNEFTTILPLKNKNTTYSEVNFEIFDICTNDYHNELYWYLEDIDKTKLDALPKDKKWINEKINKTEDVSMSKYIRNAIHHPENTKNKKPTEIELKTSINILRKLKY